jgi:hypothetical protein
LEAADTAIESTHFVYQVGGSVGRVIVDKDHLPSDMCEARIQPMNQFTHIVSFIEGRYNN